jgi:hypothetical protein
MWPCHWRTDGHLDKQQDSQPVGETLTLTHKHTHRRSFCRFVDSGFVIGSVILLVGHVDDPVFCPVCDSHLWKQCACTLWHFCSSSFMQLHFANCIILSWNVIWVNRHYLQGNIGLYVSRSKPQNVSYAQCHIKCLCCSQQPRFFAIIPSAAVPKLSCVWPSFAKGMWPATLPWKRQ